VYTDQSSSPQKKSVKFSMAGANKSPRKAEQPETAQQAVSTPDQ